MNGKQQMEPNKLSSEHIENEVRTFASETSSTEYHFKPKSRPSVINLIKFPNTQKKNWWISWNKSIKNCNRLKKNCFLSTQKYCASQKVLKSSMKYQSSIHHNSLHRRSIFKKNLHPLMRILNNLVKTSELKQKHFNLNQHLKRLLMRSKMILWIVVPPFPWIYELSICLTRILNSLV